MQIIDYGLIGIAILDIFAIISNKKESINLLTLLFFILLVIKLSL